MRTQWPYYFVQTPCTAKLGSCLSKNFATKPSFYGDRFGWDETTGDFRAGQAQPPEVRFRLLSLTISKKLKTYHCNFETCKTQLRPRARARLSVWCDWMQCEIVKVRPTEQDHICRVDDKVSHSWLELCSSREKNYDDFVSKWNWHELFNPPYAVNRPRTNSPPFCGYSSFEAQALVVYVLQGKLVFLSLLFPALCSNFCWEKFICIV